ncbi:MAG: DUF3180 family protein [Actinomycetaceae bacterium]|nr:DUF3180 family protein [Actinomycetaceae bacterium]
MKPLSLRALTGGAAIVGVLGFLLHYSFKVRALTYIAPTPFLGLLFILIACGLWYYGRKVLALKNGNRDAISVTSATNVAVFAYASAWIGAGFTGLLIGLVLPMLSDLESSYVESAVMGALQAGVGAFSLTVVAVVVERWCHIDEDDESAKSRGLEPEAG